MREGKNPTLAQAKKKEPHMKAIYFGKRWTAYEYAEAIERRARLMPVAILIGPSTRYEIASMQTLEILRELGARFPPKKKGK